MHTVPPATISCGILAITLVHPFALSLAESFEGYFTVIGVGGYIGALTGTWMDNHDNASKTRMD